MKLIFYNSLEALPSGKLLVNTINAWSYVVAQKDEAFAEALEEGDVLIPDGQSIVWAARFLKLSGAPHCRVGPLHLQNAEAE